MIIIIIIIILIEISIRTSDLQQIINEENYKISVSYQSLSFQVQLPADKSTLATLLEKFRYNNN